jgi:hypothetical protein
LSWVSAWRGVRDMPHMVPVDAGFLSVSFLYIAMKKIKNVVMLSSINSTFAFLTGDNSGELQFLTIGIRA